MIRFSARGAIYMDARARINVTVVIRNVVLIGRTELN